MTITIQKPWRSCHVTKINLYLFSGMFLIILYIQNDFSSNLLKILQLEFHIIQLFFYSTLKTSCETKVVHIYKFFIFSGIHLYAYPILLIFLQGKVCSSTNYKGILCCVVVALLVLACASKSANSCCDI